MSSMKTPGVYVVEKSAFPNSVVEVATAIPAFIGYTEKAVNGTTPLRNTPWRITSMAEFVQYFGEKPRVKFKFADSTDSTFISLNTFETLKSVQQAIPGIVLQITNAVAAANAKAKADDPTTKASDKEKEKAATDAKDALEKARGSVNAYIGSVKSLSKLLLIAKATDATNADKAQKDIDAIATSTTKVTEAMADPKTAADLQAAYTDLSGLVTAFNKNNLTEKYYSLQRTDKFSLYHNMRLFFANGGGPCYVVSVGNYNEEFTADKLLGGIDTLLAEQEPTMVVIPEAVNVDRDKKAGCFNIQQAMLQHCSQNMNRVAILDVYDGDKDRRDPLAKDMIKGFRESIGTIGLDYAAAYYPFLNTSVVSDNEVNIYNITEGLADLTTVLMSYTPQLESYLTTITAATSTRDQLELAHKVLYKQSKLYASIMKDMLQKINLLPPSAAIAGIYTLTDHTKEVWKAPANTGLANVISTAVNITHANQEDLNVPLDGKAINAIRYFTGEGIKVWGARTLDGNSLDWRYINVRRTMIMLEESIRNAAKAFVFDPNVANTWVIVRSTISNFLTGIWKRGGLAGATPEDAFSVHVGLGDTMTPDEILEGIMKITVLVAISRPAEFIEITFMQQMQKS